MGNAPLRGQMLTTRELAEAAGVHPKTVERWRYEGIGPRPVKLGPRTVRYTRSEVRKFLEGDELAGGDVDGRRR